MTTSMPRPHLDRFPERSVAAIAAIARAESRGVVFHCAGGRDRAGQIAILVLAVVGFAPEDTAADYALSAERLPARASRTASDLPGRAPGVELPAGYDFWRVSAIRRVITR
jgi:hypothetical protein